MTLAGVAHAAALMLALCAQTAPAAAQALRAGPDPALEALSFYVGDWSQTGTSRADARSNYSPLTGSETCAWIGANAAVVCRESVTDASGTSDSLYSLSWDRARQVYVVQGTDYATGAMVTGVGRLSGTTWTWDSISQSGGQRTPVRYVFEQGEGGTRTLTVTAGDDAGGWTRIQQVTYTRTAPRAFAPVRRSGVIDGSASPRVGSGQTRVYTQPPYSVAPVQAAPPNGYAGAPRVSSPASTAPARLLPAPEAKPRAEAERIPVPKLLPQASPEASRADPGPALRYPVPKLVPAPGR